MKTVFFRAKYNFRRLSWIQLEHFSGHPELNFVGKNSTDLRPLRIPMVSCQVLPDFKVGFESEKGEKGRNHLIPEKVQSRLRRAAHLSVIECSIANNFAAAP